MLKPCWYEIAEGEIGITENPDPNTHYLVSSKSPSQTNKLELMTCPPKTDPHDKLEWWIEGRQGDEQEAVCLQEKA